MAMDAAIRPSLPNRLLETFLDRDQRLSYLRDENLEYLFVNEAFREFMRKPHEEIVGKSAAQLLPVDLAALLDALDKEALSKQESVSAFVQWEGLQYETVRFPVSVPGGKLAVGGHLDATAGEARASLLQARNRYLSTLIAIAEGIVGIDAEGRIEFFNQAAERLTGLPLREVSGRHFRSVLRAVDCETTIVAAIEQAFQSGEAQSIAAPCLLKAVTGRQYAIEGHVAPIGTRGELLAGVVLVFRDVSEQEAQRKQLEYVTYHDSRTGLYNRSYLEAQLVEMDQASELPLSLIIADVNGLKLTNDIFGHLVGDHLLKTVAAALQRAVRAEDVVGRWGGDEFLILLPRAGYEQVLRIANRIRDEVAKYQVQAIRCSVSLGYATKEHPEEDLFLKLGNAESEMYEEKTLERHKVQRGSLEALLAALYAAGTPGEEHATEVGHMAGEFARAMGLPEAVAERLVQAGRYHDIGKVALVSQAGGENAEGSERRRRGQHAVIGYRLLNHFDDTVDLAEIILAHHERWDGSGYPRGLAGEEIPYLARILTLVHDYVSQLAMTSMASAEIAAGIEEQAGTHFDPALASAFLDFLSERRQEDVLNDE